ncbi:MAG: N-acetylmuramoyl-L-alanine amidase [Leptospiraceae bacterium]|nr:N-acetylmuramoyl-L-alanine amidase [Leptospiraceae bacterium]MDW8306463.1 N-acetylmuramoyl-L-alanine amidase [Leptospiraceae bacterium]
MRSCALLVFITLGISQIAWSQTYYPAEELLRLEKAISYHFDPLTLIGEIHYQKKYIRLLPYENFYTVNSVVVPIEKPAIIQEGSLYFSAELFEEILGELSLPIRYRFRGKKIQLEKAEPLPQLRGEIPTVIVLDAGHGGHDPGAFGYQGVREKDITLKVTKFLGFHLKSAFPKTKIVLTRRKDTFLPLEKRSSIANKFYSDRYRTIFISIHCNATLSPLIHGFEIYHLAINPTNMANRETELRENLLVGEEKIRELTSRLVHAQIQYESKLLSRSLEKIMQKELQGLVSSRGVRKADFAVLRYALMPAVLIELGYISNPREAQLLLSERYLNALAKALEMGIRLYSENLP